MSSFNFSRVPRSAVFLRRDDDGTEYYKVDGYVWRVTPWGHWSVYGQAADWPEPWVVRDSTKENEGDERTDD